MVSENEFPQYPSIRRIGHRESEGVLDGKEVKVREKMDGSNFRMTHEGDGLIFGSRKKVLNPNEPLKPGDTPSVGKQFNETVKFVLNRIEWDDVEWDKYENYVFFGEGIASGTVNTHTIEYQWEEIPNFLGFDIYDTEEEHFIHPNEMEFIYSEILNLPIAPLIGTFETDSFNPSEYEIPESYYRNGEPEGIIMVNPDGYPNERPVKAKRWSQEFAETHKSPSNETIADTDTELFIAKYITEQRIKKRINDMIQNGDWEKADKAMMEDNLPMKVIEDAWEEEYHEVLRSDLEINMGELRHKTCRKCVSVIEDMLSED